MNLKTIYLHINPNTSNVFYVGMGNKGRENDISFTTRSLAWQNYVKDNGLPIIWVVSHNLKKRKARKIEEELISHYGRIGIDKNGQLVNLRTGMGAKGAIFTDEQKAAKSIRRTGFRFTEEAKIKMSLTHTGKVLSEAHKKAIGNSIRGEKNGMFGKVTSDETKQKLREANLGKKQSEETIKKRMNSLIIGGGNERMRQKKLGVKMSEETKQKISAATKGVKKKPKSTKIKN